MSAQAAGSGKASFALRGHNPDVLSCIANLSNDEVFTPPDLANQMLDTLTESWAEANGGTSIWADPTVTFLDPFTKSGVFLREITARLVAGLAEHIPDLQERVDHILTRQVFGIATTTLTSLVARRSLYCSKWANGPHSIAKSFDRAWGNVWFERTEHTWAGDRCLYCGAAKGEYERGEELESHAYAFIHSSDIEARLARMFGADVHFDVVIGNPPYQLSDGGGTGSSAMPIYQKFVEQAQKLEPRFLSMVIKANWYSGGKGLDAFRTRMLGDRRIRRLVDFPDSREAFDGVDIAGGVCFFLWDRDHPGVCHVETRAGDDSAAADRVLDEFDVFVRDNRALGIIKKVLAIREQSLEKIVSARRPFGIDESKLGSGDVYVFTSSGDTLISRDCISKGVELVDAWKVLVSKTSSEHAGQTDKSGRRRVLSRIEVMPPGSASSESYLIVGPFATELEAANAAALLRTRFVRFLAAAVLLTQNITRSSFAFAPAEDFTHQWTDDDLYRKYGLEATDIAFIESQIKAMDPGDA